MLSPASRALPTRFARSDDLGAGVAHLVDRAVAIAGLKVDRTHGVFDCFNSESVFQGVEYRVFDAVVSSESTDDDLFDVLNVQLSGEIRVVES